MSAFKGSQGVWVRRVEHFVLRVVSLAFSLGSACASGSGRPSHVLRALGLDYREARSSIRLGFGRYTKVHELTDACHQIAAAAKAQEHLVA